MGTRTSVAFDFSGKVALVTGAASGIGRAAALAFARAGAKVIAVDLGEAGEEIVAAIRDAGGDGLYLAADVSSATDVEHMVERGAGHFGRLDYAFNNAGISSPRQPTVATPDALWHRILAVNLTGVWLCMKKELEMLLRQGTGGAIVNSASVGGLVGAAEMAPYSASKHGVVGLTRSAALEYADRGIRINALCPGWTRTPMVEASVEAAGPGLLAAVPMGRLAEPDEIAATVLWLCSDASSYVTGAAIVADGAYTAR